MNKGKNVVHLFTGGAMPELLHESESNHMNVDNLNCHKPSSTVDQTHRYFSFTQINTTGWQTQL